MKKTIIAIACFLMFQTVFGQSKDIPGLAYWDGGEINFNLRSSINTMGGGQGAGGFGRVIAPGISHGSASIFTNPAEIGMITNPVFYFDTKFAITSSALGIDPRKSLDKTISSGTNSFLKDTTTFKFDKVTNKRNDTKFNEFNFGQTGQFGSFALSLPLNDKIVLGFGATYPIEFSMDFLLAGVRTKMSSVKNISGQEMSIDLPLTTNYASNYRLNVSNITMGIGSKLLSTSFGTTYVGLALARYEVSEFVNFNLKIDGMLVIKKKLEYHFNDPSDINIDRAAGESNDFYWNAKGNFKTDGWGFKFGVVQSYERYNFVVAVDIVPKFVMTDNNYVNSGYQPQFITGRLAGTGTEQLNIDVTKLSLDKPNLTVPVHNSFSSTAEVSYPSSITFGGDAKFGAFTFGVNIVKYMSEFSFKLADYKLGKNPNMAGKFSMDVQLPDTLRRWGYLLAIPRLFFDFDGIIWQFCQQTLKMKVHYTNPRYRVEGGLMVGDATIEGFTDPQQMKSMNDVFGLPFPTGFAVSKEYSIFDRVHVSMMMFGIPDFALRLGLGYNL